MQFLRSNLRIFFTNKLGLILVFANLILVIWGLSEKGCDYNYFHFYHEPISIKIVTVINFPALLLGELIYSWFFPPESGSTLIFVSNSKILLISIFSIFQWLLMGYLLNLMLLSNQKEIK